MTKFTTTALTGAGLQDAKIAAEGGDASKGYIIYDEDTWTPVLTFATAGDLSVAYAANGQIGRYRRIGNIVVAHASIVTSTFTHSTASGQCQITGLPFASLNLTGFAPPVLISSWQGITKASYTQLHGTINASGSAMLFSMSGSAQAASQLVPADMPTGGSVVIRATALYFV